MMCVDVDEYVGDDVDVRRRRGFVRRVSEN